MDRAKDALDEFELEVDEAHQKLVSVDKIRKKAEADLVAMEAQLVREEEKLAKLIEKTPELNEKIEANHEGMRELKRQEEELLEEIDGLENERNQQDVTQRNLKRQIDNFKDPAQIFRSKLQHISQTSTYQIMKRGARDTLSA